MGAAPGGFSVAKIEYWRIKEGLAVSFYVVFTMKRFDFTSKNPDF